MEQQYQSSQFYTQSLKRKRRIKGETQKYRENKRESWDWLSFSLSQTAPKPDLICCHQPKFPLSLSIKIEIAQRRIGRELRQVADYYGKVMIHIFWVFLHLLKLFYFNQQNVRLSRRRRTQGQSQLSFFTLNICVSLTFLSVTLLTFLKKKLWTILSVSSCESVLLKSSTFLS